MLARLAALRQRNAALAEAQAVYTECENEIEMFRRHCARCGYAFFVLQRPHDGISQGD